MSENFLANATYTCVRWHPKGRTTSQEAELPLHEVLIHSDTLVPLGLISPPHTEPSLLRGPRPAVNSERVWGGGHPCLLSPHSCPQSPSLNPLQGPGPRAHLGLAVRVRGGQADTKRRLTPAPRRRPRIVRREALDSPQAGGGEQVGLRRQAAPSSQTDGEQRGTQRSQRHQAKEAKPPRGGRLAASDRSCPSEHRDAGGREQPLGC